MTSSTHNPAERVADVIVPRQPSAGRRRCVRTSCGAYLAPTAATHCPGCQQRTQLRPESDTQTSVGTTASTPTTTPTGGSPTAAAPRPPEAGARFVGDARPVGDIPLSRILNAACYVITGIALLAISTQPGLSPVWPIVLGLGAIAYGARILMTRSAYWVSSVVYVVAFGAVIYAISTVSH